MVQHFISTALKPRPTQWPTFSSRRLLHFVARKKTINGCVVADAVVAVRCFLKELYQLYEQFFSFPIITWETTDVKLVYERPVK